MTADPFAGDPGAVAKLSSGLADHQDDLSAGAHGVARAAEDADDWRGASKDRFSVTVGTVPRAARRIIGRLDAAIDVLDTYADDVRAIQDEAERIRAAQMTNAMEVAANTVSLSAAVVAAAGKDATEADGRRARRLRSDADDLAATASRLQAEWDALVERRATADRAASAGLSATDVLGVAPSYSGTLGRMSDADFLAAVAAMPPEVLAAQDPSVADRLAGMPPETVQAWWDGLGGRGTAGEHSAAQDALITASPAVIGNLIGVPYWARDQANRLSAQRASARAQDDVDAARKALHAAGPSARRAAQQELDDAAERLAALDNFIAASRTTLRDVDGMARQFVSFIDGQPPLGAVSIGDLDTAANVSYLVPGMGTTLEDTTVLMKASSNVIATQQLSEGGRDTAMVTWIGYDAPRNALTTGDLGVFGLADAAAGADRLAADLGGFRATRPDAHLNVVAHSYGSTTASITLHERADLGVGSFVTLGSAGIPGHIPNAGAIHAERMYAAQAEERFNVAHIGQVLSYPERIDPTFKPFGATEIDASHVNGSSAVNVHDLYVNPNGADDADHGYLDLDTNTLIETAKATLR
ncbi:alpha/beta hydrolase [Curtobacterium sp. SORGH_AS_0776]|uniref:alpha/beta hydrolase n=1 Tax=Curtobacterium sp. SORGH_AS_0776 TaxID=3041798 RepID=UPI0028658240|nr:alpha/beta hydrolase [Curtobacterium sp. SORGH_AS_0776]MDR6171136.1 uncharacterized protein YukE [Curtobacterium sp. SORGH_AS_0776]